MSRFLLPPALFLALIAGLAVLWRFHPQTQYLVHEAGLPVIEVAIVTVIGLLLLAGARAQFVHADAEINTFLTPRNLVTEGMFRFSRNPMYLGFVLVLTGAALAVNTWCAFAAPIAFFLVANFWYVPLEEKEATAAFGDSYLEYRKRTRRWI